MADPAQFFSDGRVLRDVHQAAERVAAEQRALRPAHELDLLDAEQLDARRVRVELRDAVDDTSSRAGLFGLEPMPRKRALLSLRAVNSLKNVFGAYCAASLTLSTPAFSIVSRVTAVTLTGASWTFSGSFSARTVTVGRRSRIVPSSS